MTTTVNTINGTEGNNRLTGTSGNDVINGNGGNDRINGGSGSDTLNGGAGNDELNGGSGNDVLNGGSGSDELEGGSGNDTLIYTLAENNVIGKFTYDEYEGGSGTDTLELRFTRAEWMNTTNQTVLQSYLNWANKSGSGCKWDDDFTFRFGNARLEIEDIEKLVVKVDDEFIDNVGNNMVKLLDDEIKITEDDTAVRKIDVLDNDSVNYLVKDLKLETGPAKGSVVLVKDNPNNANTWYFKYTPDNTYYQRLNGSEAATHDFTYTVTDAKGLSATATVKIKITGVNDDAEIEYETPIQLIEDTDTKFLTFGGSSIPVKSLATFGTITISDADHDESNLLRIDSHTDNLGLLQKNLILKTDPTTGEYIQADVNYFYLVENSKVQYLAQDEIKTEKFTIVSTDGTTQEIVFSIKGVNDAAMIGDPANNQVTEDTGVDEKGYITITGVISITDADQGQGFFSGQITTTIDNKGTLSLDSNGNYIYKISNEKLQNLNDGETSTDAFNIVSLDGSNRDIEFISYGITDVTNSAPVVDEIVHGEIKYAGSANVAELSKLDYSNTFIDEFAKEGVDYDYINLRTGQFYVSDLNETDTIKLVPDSYNKPGYIGNFNASISDKNSEGKYKVTWSYEVSDRDLDTLSSRADHSTNAIQTYSLSFSDTKDVTTTSVIINLSEEDIDVTNAIYFGDDDNNEILSNGIDTPSGVDIAKLLYLGAGDDFAFLNYGSPTVFGENGDDEIQFFSESPLAFGGNGNDSITLGYNLIQGLAFGGDGNDDFILEGQNSIRDPDVKRESFMWGGEGSNIFKQEALSKTGINDWIMDFDGSNPNNGGDKIEFVDVLRKDGSRLVLTPHVWKNDVNKTQLITHQADSSHPFISEGSIYYELQAKSSVDLSDSNWYSVLNLVGTNITLDGLFANGNLDPIQAL